MKPDRRLATEHKRATGFSLLEIMIAMVLSFIVIAGVISVYLASKRSLTEVEQVASLSENGRFALQVLGYSVRHIGFYGGASPADIRMDTALGTVSGNCTGAAAAYDTDNSFFALRATSGAVADCIQDAMPGTDVLVIKGVDPRPLYDADPAVVGAPRDGNFPAAEWDEQQTYVIANSESGMLLDGADTPPDVREGNEFALAAAWPYRVQIFYIRNGATPTLSRKVLSWDAEELSMSMKKTQDLVHGVENMRFLFGYDSNNDGKVDTLANLDGVNSLGNAGDLNSADAWSRVASLQAFLLLRSDVSDPGYTNAKTYMLGDDPIQPPPDGVRRILLHTDIALRNPGLLL